MASIRGTSWTDRLGPHCVSRARTNEFGGLRRTRGLCMCRLERKAILVHDGGFSGFGELRATGIRLVRRAAPPVCPGLVAARLGACCSFRLDTKLSPAASLAVTPPAPPSLAGIFRQPFLLGSPAQIRHLVARGLWPKTFLVLFGIPADSAAASMRSSGFQFCLAFLSWLITHRFRFRPFA